MDRVILTEKLESLRRCLQRIEAKTPGDVESLRGDPDLQDIVVLNLTRAVQVCVDIGSLVYAVYSGFLTWRALFILWAA